MTAYAKVVPYAGTWIENMIEPYEGQIFDVVPYAGTWIENAKDYQEEKLTQGRSLCGNVD